MGIRTFDHRQEEPLSMSELAAAIQKQFNTQRSVQTLKNWIKVGCTRKSDGEIIQLQGMQIGDILHSSIESYERFIEELNQ